MNIFFTADTHFNHKNIVRGTSEWGDTLGQRVRDFDTLEQHNQTLVNNINGVVKENDILYHLGDWSFGGIESIWDFRRQLYCKNIHFILGNHDHHIVNNKVLPNERLGWDIGVPTHAQSLFASVNQYLQKKINGQHMFLCHYAMRTWDKAHHGVWMLYGHSHGSLSDYKEWHYENKNGESVSQFVDNKAIISTIPHWKAYKFKSMDVGIDTHSEFRPYHFDEIAFIMKDRINLVVDHHNEKTN